MFSFHSVFFTLLGLLSLILLSRSVFFYSQFSVLLVLCPHSLHLLYTLCHILLLDCFYSPITVLLLSVLFYSQHRSVFLLRILIFFSQSSSTISLLLSVSIDYRLSLLLLIVFFSVYFSLSPLLLFSSQSTSPHSLLLLYSQSSSILYFFHLILFFVLFYSQLSLLQLIVLFCYSEFFSLHSSSTLQSLFFYSQFSLHSQYSSIVLLVSYSQSVSTLSLIFFHSQLSVLLLKAYYRCLCLGSLLSIFFYSQLQPISVYTSTMIHLFLSDSLTFSQRGNQHVNLEQ